MSAAHVLAGRRSAMLRGESNDRVRDELERTRPEMVALFNRNAHRVPLKLVGQSRLEWFHKWAEEQGETAQWDAIEARIDDEIRSLIAQQWDEAI